MAGEPPISQEPIDDPQRRRRFEAALGAYFEALDAGQSPDRQELLARHPDLVVELAEFFAEQDRFHRLVAPLRPEPAEPGESPARPPGEPTDPHHTDPGMVATRPTVPGTAAAEVTEAQPSAEARDSSPPARANGDGMDLPRGTRVSYFGDYELIRELGRGGMGVVYRARQLSLNRPVALKMIRAGVLADDAELRRFQNEAEAVALLDHVGVVPVYEVGEHDGQRYFSMKLVEGGSLAERLDRYKDDPRAAASLAAEAAEAVAHAHARGILHRDLKPANILVDDRDHPHVTDFGLAKRVNAGVEMTASGAILGTPAYMSPEQASGRRGSITTATDVYGLGAVLYAMLTGRAPFGDDSVVDTLMAVRERPPEPPRKLNPKVPRDLEVICLKCLGKDPHRRYPTAQALADDLRAWLGARPIAARPVGTAARAWLWCRRRPAVAALSTALVVVAGICLAVAGTQWRAAVANAEGARKSAREANDNAAKALENEREAVRRGEELARSNRRLRLAGYASAMQLAQREWEMGDIHRVRSLLGSLRPAAGEEDLRGFEWRYLLRQCDDAVLTLRLPGAPEFPLDGLPRIAVSPDGRRCLAVGGGRVMAWELPGGRPGALAPDPDRYVLDAVYSPDGRRLATLAIALAGQPMPGSWPLPILPTVLEIRDAATGGRLVSAGLPRGNGGRLAYRPGGHQVAARVSQFVDGAPGPGANPVTVVDARTGRVLRTHDAKDINEALAYSPDGKRLVGPVDTGALAIWDAETGRMERTVDTTAEGIIRAVAFHPDGTRLAVACDSGRVTVWSVPGWKVIQSLQAGEQMALGCRFSPDGESLATQADGSIKIWDGVTGRYRFAIHGAYRDLTFTPDGGRIAAAGDAGTVRFWDAKQAQGASIHREKGSIHHLRFSIDGRRVIDEMGTVLDVATGSVVRIIPGSEAEILHTCVLLPDGARAVLVRSHRSGPKSGAAKTGHLILWDIEAARELRRLPVSPVPFFLSISPDGRWLLSLSAREGHDAIENDLVVRDVTTWETVLARDGRPVYGTSAMFSPDSRSILVGEKDRVALIEIPSGRERSTYGPLSSRPLFPAISPDSRWVAGVLSGSRTIPVWDAASGVEVQAITLPGGSDVTAASFSPDGRRLATCGFDAKIRIWDTETSQELLTLTGHRGWIWEVWFTPDGRRIVSGSSDGTIRIWDAGPLPSEAGFR
jgi:WD40 repeat protein